MKRKYFFVVLFLMLAMFLVGCSGVGPSPSITDETKIMDLINKYLLAICDFDFDLAKSYCYPGSSAYLMVEYFQGLMAQYPQVNEVLLWITPTIYSIDVTGNEATAKVSFFIQMWYYTEYFSDTTDILTMIFIKSGGEWYFYW